MTRSWKRFWWLCLPLALLAGPAIAAEEGHKGPSEVIFIAEILALMIVGRLLGEAMVRMRQPAVMGQLIAGLLLGPSLFGLLTPDLQHALFPKNPEQKAMIDAISQFGILLLLLMTGMETDLKLVRQVGRAAVFASLCGIVDSVRLRRDAWRVHAGLSLAGPQQAADHRLVSRHRAVDRFGQDRGDGGA